MEDKAKDFDPEGVGVSNGNYFGFPFSPEQADVVIYPVEWDVTTSYGAGTCQAPKAILDASPQLDFFDFENPNRDYVRIGTVPPDKKISEINTPARKNAKEVIDFLETGGNPLRVNARIKEVNAECEKMVEIVYRDTLALLNKGKKVVLLGGDHSTPLGYVRAMTEKHDSFGILHIDAHADMRDAYEGFEYSHASIMNNILKSPQIKSLVQVGIRDISRGELNKIEAADHVKLFTDFDIQKELFKGTSWDTVCQRIISELPEKVYISFDIDGLHPTYCPNTGTPVPGGLEFPQAVYLMNSVMRSGRQIIGADLCEVAPGDHNDWDANVGARILYRLCSLL